ncbi:MAG: Sulfur oxidation protein SoxZ, partial [uncultured Ramlibacter sp.]
GRSDAHPRPGPRPQRHRPRPHEPRDGNRPAQGQRRQGHPGLAHHRSHRGPQRQAGVQGRVGPGGGQEPVPAVHRQGRQGRRQDRGELEGQPGRDPNRRSRRQL